jgi:hypothetical protein
MYIYYMKIYCPFPLLLRKSCAIKNVSIIRRYFFLSIVCIVVGVSCKKNDVTQTPNTTSGGGTLLESLTIKDSISPTDVDFAVYKCFYNANSLITNTRYIFTNVRRQLDSTFHVVYSYNSGDTMPFKMVETDLVGNGSSIDTSVQTHFYKYDALGRIVTDSLIAVQRQSNYFLWILTKYSWLADGYWYKYNLKTNFGQNDSTTRNFLWERDAKGNVIKETVFEPANNTKSVIELTYDDKPNPLFRTYKPLLPMVREVVNNPYYLGNIRPQPNNFITVTYSAFSLTTGLPIYQPATVSFNYQYKANGYPMSCTSASKRSGTYLTYSTYTYNYQ